MRFPPRRSCSASTLDPGDDQSLIVESSPTGSPSAMAMRSPSWSSRPTPELTQPGEAGHELVRPIWAPARSTMRKTSSARRWKPPPTLPRRSLALPGSHALRNRTDEARQGVDEVLRTSPDNLEALLLSADIAFADQRADDALADPQPCGGAVAGQIACAAASRPSTASDRLDLTRRRRMSAACWNGRRRT